MCCSVVSIVSRLVTVTNNIALSVFVVTENKINLVLIEFNYL